MNQYPPTDIFPPPLTAFLNPAMQQDFSAQAITLIRLAVREDLGYGPVAFDPAAPEPESPPRPTPGDATSVAAIPENMQARARMIARQNGVVAGLVLMAKITAEYSNRIQVELCAQDGDAVQAGATLATVCGPARAILSAERVLLNFVGRLSGIATLTRSFVTAARTSCGPNMACPHICDTRKTTPGWRHLEKYAVRCGGGLNHRMGLYDGIMLKDNHLAALAQQLGPGHTLADLTLHVRENTPREIPVWLEVDTLSQLADALPGGADIILLDNMPPAELRRAVEMRDRLNAQRRPLLEASGGITLANIGDAARTGVERISIGALTHSAAWMDVSMECDADDQTGEPCHE